MNSSISSQHNYRAKINLLIEQKRIPNTRGTIARLDVKHDDSCALFKGQWCDCDPDIYLDGKKVNPRRA